MRGRVSSSSKQSSSYVTIDDFKNTTMKECTSLDRKNEKIYRELLEKAKRAEKTIQNSILSVNLEVPPPPRPSNLERYNIWNKRNILKPVIEQSEAVLFLQSRGFILNDDYEAYQAIDLSKEIKNNEGIVESSEDKTTQFNKIFTNNDNNILRRRSIHRMYAFNKKEEEHKSKLIRSNSDSSLNQQESNVSFGFNNYRASYMPQEQQTYQVKPSAPPMSHSVVYPNPNFNSYYDDCNLKKEYEV